VISSADFAAEVFCVKPAGQKSPPFFEQEETEATASE
jgi:hypothetical protein